jgi:hypothetical protein
MYLSGPTFLTFGSGVNFTTSLNHASQYGGGIYYEDTAVRTQCSLENSLEQAKLPRCFINLGHAYSIDARVYSYGDSASKGGSFLYGGLLDRCYLDVDYEHLNDTILFKLINSTFDVRGVNATTWGITSDPYQLCFCDKEHKFSGNTRSTEVRD